jgi:hypothetical protein
MGSNFPSAIAMAIDEGISLVQFVVKENKCDMKQANLLGKNNFNLETKRDKLLKDTVQGNQVLH